MDLENGNNDEFGDTDSVSWVTGDDYLEVSYDYNHHVIRWDYDGNVIFDSAEKEKEKLLNMEQTNYNRLVCSMKLFM